MVKNRHFWRFLTILDVFKGNIAAKLVYDLPNPRKISAHAFMVSLRCFSLLNMIIFDSNFEKHVKIMIFIPVFDFYIYSKYPFKLCISNEWKFLKNVRIFSLNHLITSYRVSKHENIGSQVTISNFVIWFWTVIRPRVRGLYST